MTTVALGEIVDFYSGGTPSKASDRFWRGDVPWISAKDMKHARLTRSIDHVSDEVFSSTSLRKLPPGTVVMVVRGMILAHTIPIGILEVEAAINQDLKALLPRDGVVPAYLAGMLRAQQAAILAEVSTAAHGTKKLESRVLEQIRIPLPPIEEQRRIADVLDRADALRTKRREALALLDDLTQSIFLDMFGDPQTNPQGWVRRPLGSIVRGIDNGSSPICEARPATQDEWGVLKLSALTRGMFDAAENKAYLGAVDAMARNEVRSGDLLMTRKNTRDLVGAVALVRDVRPRLLMPDLVFRLDVDEGVARKSYLQALLMHPRKRPEIAGLSNGSAASMPNISKARLRTLPLELPPLESQLEFERRVLAVQNLHSRTLEAAVADHDLFDALQQRAFSGLL